MRHLSDKREFTRVPMLMEVELKLAGRPALVGHARDVSLGGLHLITQRPPPVWSTSQMVMRIPQERGVCKMTAWAQVVRHGEGGCGLVFTDIPITDFHMLVDLLVTHGVDPERMITELTRRLTLPPRPFEGLSLC